MRKYDPFADTGILIFRMSQAQKFSIKPGSLVTVEDGTHIRLAHPDEPVRTFTVPANASVEASSIGWKQDEPIKPVDQQLLEPSRMDKFQLAKRIEHHVPAIETACEDSRELERRELREAQDTRTFVRGPRLDHRKLLCRLRDDVRELINRLARESRQQ